MLQNFPETSKLHDDSVIDETHCKLCSHESGQGPNSSKTTSEEGFFWQTDKRREGRLNDVQKLIEVQTEYISYNNNNYINQNWDKITKILAYHLEHGRTFYDFSDNSYRTLEDYILFEKLYLIHSTLFRMSQVFSFQMKGNTSAVRKIYSDLSTTLYRVTNKVFSLIAVLWPTERPRGVTINEFPADRIQAKSDSQIWRKKINV